MKLLRIWLSTILVIISFVIVVNSILNTQFNVGYELAPTNIILWGSLCMLALNIWNLLQTQRYKSQIYFVVMMNWSGAFYILDENRRLIENELLFYLMFILIVAMLPLAIITQDSQDRDEKGEATQK